MSHILHTNGFSPVCVDILQDRVNRVPQISLVLIFDFYFIFLVITSKNVDRPLTVVWCEPHKKKGGFL